MKLAERFPPFVENAGKVPCSPAVDRKLTLESLEKFSNAKNVSTGQTLPNSTIDCRLTAAQEMVPLILEQCSKLKEGFQEKDTILDLELEKIISKYRDSKCKTKKPKSGKKKSADKDAKPSESKKSKESAKIKDAIRNAGVVEDDRDEL